MPAGFVPTVHTAIASRRKPKGGNPRHSPLSAMTVSAENQINGMMRFDVVENVRRMRQQHRKLLVGARRDASKICPMKRGVIDADNHQLSPSR